MNLLFKIEIFDIMLSTLSILETLETSIYICNILDININWDISNVCYAHIDTSLFGSRECVIDTPDSIYSESLIDDAFKDRLLKEDIEEYINETISQRSRFTSNFYVTNSITSFSNWESLAQWNAEILANNNNKLLLLMDNLIIWENTLENNWNINVNDINLMYIKPLNKIELHEILFINFKDATEFIKSYIYEPVIFLENVILIFSKIFYNYFEYLQSLINFYGNYKNLTNKILVNTNNFENFYNTLSLNLILNIQSQNYKVFLWLFENFKKDVLNKNIIIEIFKNYNYLNKNDTYSLFKKLSYLNKKHARINILTYGFFYDINIISNNIGFESDNTPKVIYNNFNENNKLLFNNSNFIKTNVKLNKYFNKNLINKVYFKNIYKHNNLVILNKINDDTFSSKIQKYLINIYFELYINKDNTLKNNEKNQMYHYFFKKKHYTMYNRDRPFEMFLPYKGHIHYGYEDNLSHYINDYWKKNLLYSDRFFTRYIYYKEWDTIIFKYIFGNLINDSTHITKTFKNSTNLHITPKPTLTRSGLYLFFDICRTWVDNSKNETFKKIINYFFKEKLLLFQDFKLFYLRHFMFNINNLVDERTGIQYMPIRDYLNHEPWQGLVTSYRKEEIMNYVEKLEPAPIKTIKQWYIMWRKDVDIWGRGTKYEHATSIEKFSIDNIKLKNFGGYSQWWAWQQDSAIQKIQNPQEGFFKGSFKGFFKRNPNFTVFLKNINENIKKNYNDWQVWYPLRYNSNDLGTYKVANMNKEAWKNYNVYYFSEEYLRTQGVYIDLVTDYDEKVITEHGKRGPLGWINLAKVTNSEREDYFREGQYQVYKPLHSSAKKKIVISQDEILADTTMEEIRQDQYKTLRGYGKKRKAADFQEKLAKEIWNYKEVKRLGKKRKKRIPHDMEYLIRRRKIYLGTWPDYIKQPKLEGLEPRVEFKKRERVASINDRVVIWGAKINWKWRPVWKAYKHTSTPFLVLKDSYSNFFNRQHGETYFNLNKKSWKMFLTGDDVFLLGDTLGIIKKKEKDIPDTLEDVYIDAEIYAEAWSFQNKKPKWKHFNLGLNRYTIDSLDEGYKDYLRNYKITYLKGNFTWPKKMQWAKDPYLYTYTPNSRNFYLNNSPFFSITNWLKFYYTDTGYKKDVLSTEYDYKEMKQIINNFSTYKKKYLIKYVKDHSMEYPLFKGKARKWSYVFNIILKDSKAKEVDPNRKWYYIDDSEELSKEEEAIIKKETFTYYKKFIKRMKNSLIKSEKIKRWGEKNIISFFLPQYIQDSFIDTKNKLFINYIRKDIKLEWSSFYTNIEDLSGFSKLHIISKDFYTSYIDKKKINEEVLLRKVLTNNIELPKIKHILLKKSYIISLIDFFQKDENLLKNYILYNIRKQQFFFFNEIVTFYKVNIVFKLKMQYELFLAYTEFVKPKELLKRLFLEQLVKVQQFRWFINFYSKYEDQFSKLFKFLLKYIPIGIIILIYCGITSLLVMLIKNCLPNNIIYGINIKEKLKVNTLLDKVFKEKTISYVEVLELEKLMEININENEREKILEEICNNLDDINKKKIKMFFFEKNLNLKNSKLKDVLLKKNIFDAEHKYIYMWEKRKDPLYMDSDKLEKNLKKVRVYNKFEEKKNKDLKENYITFYKTLIFEKNLEKLKDNTKVRYDFWYNKKFYSFLRIVIKGLWFSYKDRKYNVSKLLFWNDDELFNQLNDKIKYVYVVPRPLEDVIVIIIFLYYSAKYTWSFRLWVHKLYSYVIGGEHVHINYRELMEDAENYIWARKRHEAKFDTPAIYLHLYINKILTKFKEIKELPLNKDLGVRINRRETLLKDITKLSTMQQNLIKIRGTIKNINEIDTAIYSDIPLFFKKNKLDKIERPFEKKFNNIQNKLKTELILSKTELMLLKQWKEQELRIKYLNKAYINKFEAVKEDKEKWIENNEKWLKVNEQWIKEFETAEAKRKFPSRNLWELEKDSKYLNIDNIDNIDSLEYINIDDIEPILYKRKKITKQKLDKVYNIEYEKYLRAYNFKVKFIDKDLDNEDIKFYESISDYNKELDEEYLKIEEQEKPKKILEMEYEKKSNFFYGIYKKRTPYNRWWPTIGMRLNYILAQLVGIFAGLKDNFKKIRRNNNSISTLVPFILNDIYVFIYKMYWEYLIIWQKKNTLKNLGNSIKDILKFSLILTPILIYSFFLYLILLIIVLLYRFLWTFPKTIYQRLVFKKSKKSKKYSIWKKKINRIIFNLKKILNILSILFKDLETGDNILKQIYYKFYKFCAFIQYNLFYFKGAYILGYKKNNKIIDGIISMKELLKLKYIVWFEKKKRNLPDNILYYFLNNLWGFDKEKFDKTNNHNEEKFEKMDLSKLDFILILFDSYHLRKSIDSILKIKRNLLNKIQNKIQNILNKLKNYKNFEAYKRSYLGYKEIILKEENTVTDYDEKLEIIRQRKLKIKFNKILFFYYKLSIKDWITILDIHNKLNLNHVKELINLLLIKIWDTLRLPFTYFIYSKKKIYVENYIEGKKKKSRFNFIEKYRAWKLRIHNIVISGQISNMLITQLYEKYDFGDVFFVYKIDEVKWKKKNFYQDYFWKNCYWIYKRYRSKIFMWLINFISEFEENYRSFDDDIGTKGWTLREKFFYAYNMITFYNHAFSFDLQRKKSRDAFFYKKIKEKDKLEFIFFIKGLLNWITYIITGKIIFSKIKNLNKKAIEYKSKDKEIKHEVNNIKQTLYLSNYIKEIPPQFWSLFIIYNKYYKYFLRYSFKDKDYPIKWKLNANYETSRDYKWRLAVPDHNYYMNPQEIRNISTDVNSYSFEDFMASLSTGPYDPMIRWLVFIIENGMTREQYDEQGLELFNEEKFTWGDISLTHLLTYNKKLDQYKYEIREFDRLIQGLDKMYVKFDSKIADKEKFYREKFNLVSQTLLKENEGILKNLLKERRLKNAKMLHDALVRNRLKTSEEMHEDLARENMKEFFYERKKFFFEQQVLEQFLDWQAEFESKSVEDKYFNTADILRATFTAKNIENIYLKRKNKMFGTIDSDYNYLLNNIVLKSFDQTIEEIHYFLVFKVWKILEKQLKVKGKKTQINYKHLDSNLEILERINYNRSAKEYTILSRDKMETEHEYINNFNKLEWEFEKNERISNFPDNNILLSIYQFGLSFRYEDKIQYNKEAERYQKEDLIFHGHEALSELVELVENRVKYSKNISKTYIGEKKKKNHLVYISNIKWTWQQWLLYTNIDKENLKFDKTIVILNERFHLWNLKRMPIRIKLPVLLDLDGYYLKTYFADKNNYMSFLDHKHFLLTRTVGAYLKQSLNWEVCKKYLEKHFNKDIKDLVLWIFTANALNREVLQIKKDYAYVFENFARNYNLFHKLYFVGMPHYTWDLLKYHKIFLSREDFPYDEFLRLKQAEFINHDPGVTKIARRVEFLYLDKYSPAAYVFLFKTHFFFERYFTRMYNLLSIASFFWAIKILFYTELEYLSENYVLFIPLLAMFFFWYLRKRTKIIKDHYKGEELYLYRFKSSKPSTDTDREIFEAACRKNAKKWLEHFYSISKAHELFMIDDDEVTGFTYDKYIAERIDPEWWRYHTHQNKDNKIEGYQHIEVWIFFFISFYLVQYWKSYQFEYRNSPWIWFYYKISERTQERMRLYTSRIPTSYKLREWIDDSYARFEHGGNTVSRFLENYYRQKKGLSIKPLDYGHDWQIITEMFYPVYHDEVKRAYFYKLGYAELEWLQFSRILFKFNVRGLDKVRSLSGLEIIANDPNELKDVYRKQLKKRMVKKFDLQEKLLKESIEFKEPLGYKRGITNGVFVEEKQDWAIALVEKMRTYKINDLGDYQDVNLINPIREDFESKELLMQFFDELKDLKNRLKTIFKKWLFDKKYINEKNPYRKWYEFQDFVMDKWNFDIKDKKHIFPNFLFKMQTYADNVIEEDKVLDEYYKNVYYKNQYYKNGAFDFNKYFNYDTDYVLHTFLRIQNFIKYKIIDYQQQLLWRSRYLDKMRKKYLLTNNEIDIRTLLSISETEKHLTNCYYNMLKYRLSRIESITRVLNKKHLKKIIKHDFYLYKNQSLLKSYKETNFFIRWLYSEQQYKRNEKVLEQNIEKIQTMISKHKLKKQNYDNDLINFKIILKKYENYVFKINKKIKLEDVVEYKCKLISNYIETKETFWIFLADLTEQLSIIELISIIIKILAKFF